MYMTLVRFSSFKYALSFSMKYFQYFNIIYSRFHRDEDASNNFTTNPKNLSLAGTRNYSPFPLFGN